MSRPVELSGYDEFMRKQGLGLDHRGPIAQLAEANETVADMAKTLRYIADEESGWRFRVDPLEHARSVIEEMREMAREAIKRWEAR